MKVTFPWNLGVEPTGHLAYIVGIKELLTGLTKTPAIFHSQPIFQVPVKSTLKSLYVELRSLELEIKIYNVQHTTCVILFTLCSTDQGMHLINFKITHVFMNVFPSSHREFVLSALLGSCSLSPASANACKYIQAAYITWNCQGLIRSMQMM